MGAVRLPDSLLAAGLVHAKQKSIQRHPIRYPVSPEIDCIIIFDHFDIGGSGEDVTLEIGQ